jgi:hypothetical protein
VPIIERYINLLVVMARVQNSRGMNDSFTSFRNRTRSLDCIDEEISDEETTTVSSSSAESDHIPLSEAGTACGALNSSRTKSITTNQSQSTCHANASDGHDANNSNHAINSNERPRQRVLVKRDSESVIPRYR